MSLTLHEVRRIAHLARLEFTPADESAMLAQLNDFFGIVEQMRAVDTAGVEPLFTPLSALGDVSLRLRDDAVSEPVGVAGRNANLRNAPAVEDGLLLVPKVLE